MTEKKFAFQEPGRFARGWHIILFSHELEPGQHIKKTLFGNELVLFRSEGGVVGVVDAFCPHMGANLGNPHAKVVGENIVCPFHGWEFGSDGECKHIPNANNIPERAKNTNIGWLVDEKCGFIAIWYDREGGAPDWSLPEIPDWGKENWGDWDVKRSTIKAQGQDIIENMADRAHFEHVHGGRVEEFDLSFDGHTITQKANIVTSAKYNPIVPNSSPEWFQNHLKDPTRPAGGSDGEATYFGPACMYFSTHMTVMGLNLRAFWLNVHVPVDDEHVELCSAILAAPGEGQLDDDNYKSFSRDLYPEIAHAAFQQDVEIWADKKYLPNPIYSEADGPIHKLRKWYDEFYRDRMIAKAD